uniref:SymE family type I addiction module toxin n=1 Tax=Agathobacter sp. TaxID=2021311 RepID=UPI004055FCD9
MKTKKIKVRYSNRSWGTHYSGGSSTNPCISMEGKWLEEIGFHIGDHVQVEYQEGTIVIRTLPAEAPLSMVAEPKTSYGSSDTNPPKSR